MKRFASMTVVCALMVVLRPGTAAAQIPGFDWVWGNKVEKVDANHWRVIGAAEFWQDQTRFNADKADYYEDTHRLIASGNVTVSQADTADGPPTSSISAQAIDFNTDTQTGTFYGSPAWGVASLGNRVDRSMFGTLEPDMYFYGETIEKLGPKKYRLTKGGFTTCVQPVPRWELTSGSVVITLEHYALLRNPVLRVKGVPLFYVPILYYPVKTKEDRSTGFLMPSYGTSTIGGFRLSNAFFWAISRSQDLTIMHDWFTKTGQGLSEEYRYVRAPGSQGNFSFSMLNEHPVTTLDANGVSTTTPGKSSYQFRGSANETINSHLRAGGRISYFTDVITQQTYNLNIYDASRSQRTINANLLASLGSYRMTGTFDRAEYFSGTTDSALTAATPRVSFTRSERPLGSLPVYVSLGGEYVTLQRGSTSVATDGTKTVTDLQLSRIDFNPTVRVPFTKLAFLTVNSSVAWRGTFWTKSWDANHNLLDQSVSRRMFDFQSDITGPVFNRIFTPDNGYAEKIKHTIEPFLNLRYTTAVPDFDRIVQWDGIDGIFGGTPQATYGVNNRLFAKRKRDGKVLPSREIFSVGIQQTYYWNARASQYDLNYGSSYAGITKPYNFSAVKITARSSPTDRLSATFRSEIDARYKMLRSVSASENYSVGTWLTTSAGWTLTRSIAQDGTINAGGLRHFLEGNANARLAANKYGGNYSFNYDVVKGQFVTQRLTGYYNAQCCGFAVEYQTFNFGNLPVGVPEDHRFNFSFTLAGLGSFSNFFGALGGAPR